MKIIIAGCGKVGYALAEQLNEEGHELTIIDINEEKEGWWEMCWMLCASRAMPPAIAYRRKRA